MPNHISSPIDLPEEEDEPSGLGWACGVIFIASLFLLLTNAVSLRDWIDDQPPGRPQAQAAALADAWLATTQDFGVAIPRAAMHEQWKRTEAARFPATSKAEPRAAPTDQR